MKWIRSVALCCVLIGCSFEYASATFVLLVQPQDFRLTLEENPNSTLPLGPSCTGDAGLTVTCRAFTLTLENESEHVIHIVKRNCEEPAVIIERKKPEISVGWWPVKRPHESKCENPEWIDVRLEPGQSIQHTTRLVPPQDYANLFAPGVYTLRARWMVFGCVESSDGTGCPLPSRESAKWSLSLAPVNYSEATVVSNEAIAESSALPDLPQKFSFEVSVVPDSRDKRGLGSAARECAARDAERVSCTVIRAKFRNLEGRAARWFGSSCGGIGIKAEFRIADEPWKPVPEPARPPLACSATIGIETPILVGGSTEWKFTLTELGYDPAHLPAADKYRFRFTLWQTTCIAAPDGSFCLAQGRQKRFVSPEVEVRAK